MIRIQTELFDIGERISAMTRDRTDIGAVVSFSGFVRDDDGLKSMTLEHYPGMTEDELERISLEAAERFRLSAFSVVHRIGALKPGDNIVLVVACAPHRQDAFDGCAFLMDYLKTRAPFWKKEAGPGDEGQWVEARDSDGEAIVKWRQPED